ncbi:hypothetical protein PAESOLCIP111_03731 [Paenibacillus solanacearum]|uniref:Uncharacterized protein n=1 Tax=Paenibacillus solanacearum TaxID=2048548 RepID=A0A916K323_9BACL|nr:hypothetical protein [Paenibacillus solanacearum]CAG7636025.1 hypothetical protein PAESOLCIP111_03731 [Paenibacillus solanacearum]
MAISYDLHVDKNTFMNNDNIALLREAAGELFSASEKDFEQIKSRKWYKRIWQLITFSKDNEKILASNITSLAKAQDIILKLLLSLSDDNKEVAMIISDLSNQLHSLTCTTESIARRVIDVDTFIKYGYKKNALIVDFSDAQKSVLLSALNYIADKHGFTEELSAFLSAIRRMAQFHERSSEFDLQTLIFDEKESRAIFPLLLELNYLCTSSFDLCDEISEIVDHLSISNANKKKIQQQVEMDIKRIGINGMIDLYNAIAPSYDIDDWDIEFVDAFVDVEDDAYNSHELIEITISSITHIAKGEIKEYRNNVIHLNSYIDCAGTIVFENCEIYYNEIPGTPCQITLKEGSSLSIRNCRILCRNLEKNPLFKDDGSVSILIKNSVFEDCSYFIEKLSGDDCNFVMQGCEIINPYIYFLNLRGLNEGIINNCLITFNKPLPEKEDFDYGDIFCSSQWGETKNITVSEVIVNGNNFFNVKDEDGYFKRTSHLFNMKYASYTNCTFENVNYCINDAGMLSHCRFNKCEKVIEIGFNIKNCNVTHCAFAECQSVISGNRMVISFCQFVGCINNLIESSVVGKVKVEYCEFYNIKYINSVRNFSTACLTFHRSKGNEYGYSTVKKCIFNGAELNDGFLIAGKANENIKGISLYIEECSFQNCKTKRESGKIIKCYDTYLNLFNKQIQIEVTTIQNCLGLDKVNEENGYVADVIVKAKDNTGAVIGAAAAGFASGGILGAVTVASGMIIKNKLTTDTDRHIE